MNLNDVLEAMEAGQFTRDELLKLRSQVAAYGRGRRVRGNILAIASINVGDRVRINNDFWYKTLRGLEGVVETVNGGAASPFWTQFQVRLDFLPKRRPKYAVVDGTLYVGGDCLDLIASVSTDE
jgi:hypothetical protein